MVNSARGCLTGLTVWIIICQPRLHVQFYQMYVNSSSLPCRQLSMTAESVSCHFVVVLLGLHGVAKCNCKGLRWENVGKNDILYGGEGKHNVFPRHCSLLHVPIPDGTRFLRKYAHLKECGAWSEGFR